MANQRVLVVEDNRDNMLLIVDVLESLDYDVIQAEDGEQGVSLASTEHPDLIEGFKVLDSHLLERQAPKIQWGAKFKLMNTEAQIKYLMNLASTMNHAAWLIQNERNQLITLCELKDNQLKAQQKSVNQNNEMLQSEVTKMNTQRQSYNKELARLNTRIRELERGD